MYVSNSKLKTVVFHFRLSFVFFSLVLAMAPKQASRIASTRSKRQKCDTVGFIPVGETVAASSADDVEDQVAKNTSDEIVPFIDCKKEQDKEDNGDEKIDGAKRASKGNGMNPLEVSRMLAMLGKRRKKDRACMRMCSTYLGIYINTNTHIYVRMFIIIWRSPSNKTRLLLEETTIHVTSVYCVAT